MKMLFSKEYLSPSNLEGFSNYRYSCIDTSPLSTYVMHPFWNFVIKLTPMSIAPNLLTLLGFLCCLLHYGLLSITDYSFTASVLGSSHTPIPSFIWFSVSLLLFLSHTLDGIDGKQARRTGTSGPVGELFDHGLDSWSSVLIASSLYSTFGNNDDNYSISLYRMLCLHWIIFFNFHVSHWEKYNTGILYLPWSYDLSMVSGTLLYLITSITGANAWKCYIGGLISPGVLLEVLVYSGSLGLSLPMASYNIYTSHKKQKDSKILWRLSPCLSFALSACLLLTWAFLSSNRILESDPRAFYLLSGTLYSQISCRLIVAQMSSSTVELINVFLLPLALLVSSSLFLPVTLLFEQISLYSLLILCILFHLHYGICVIYQMSNFLNIQVFKISVKSNNNNEYDGDNGRSVNSKNDAVNIDDELHVEYDSKSRNLGNDERELQWKKTI